MSSDSLPSGDSSLSDTDLKKEDVTSPQSNQPISTIPGRSDLPKITVLDRNRIEKRKIQMEFVTRRDSNGRSISAELATASFTLANMKWEVGLQKEGHAELELYCRLIGKRYSNKWKIAANLQVEFSRKDEDGIVKKEVNVPFQLDGPEFDSFSKLCGLGWQPLVKKLSEGVQTASTVIDVQIAFTVEKLFGFRSRTVFSYDFCQDSRDADLVFKFGDKRVFLNCNFLSFHSPYFAAIKDRLAQMEKDTNGLPLEEMMEDVDEFSELMQTVYPSKLEITDINVSYILKLADRFLFDSVLIDCEKFLMSDECNTDISVKLHWSSEYNMYDLQDHSLSQIKFRSDLDNVRKGDHYRELTADVLRCLLDRSLDLEA